MTTTTTVVTVLGTQWFAGEELEIVDSLLWT
jgi:hypothetical protein